MMTALELLLLAALGSTIAFSVLFCIRHYRNLR